MKKTEGPAVPDIVGIRAALRITQEEMGRQLNVSQQTVAKWEAGTARPSRMTIVNIGEVLARGLATCWRQAERCR